ncbi:ryncolin-1-like [Ylistrum balloti]|uniref:ryncolin-1-like n=1 Tax=Ylistrum balloti TaxID=509963 RepID=UPI002905C2CE|nr:ryncolin-1-like [Ylistrum balloti]
MQSAITTAFVAYHLTYFVCEGKSSRFTRHLPENHESDISMSTNNIKKVMSNVPSMPKCAILCHRSDCEAFDFNSDKLTCRFLSHTSIPNKSFFLNTDVESCHSLPPGHPSGVYRVKISEQVRKMVFCNMDSVGGGWTVLQNRFDGSQDFNLYWDDYRDGFGKPHGEYWIGNENMHLLTLSQRYKLRIELTQASGDQGYAEYNSFTISSEVEFYRLEISEFSGNIYNSFQHHNNKKFSARDKDNDDRIPVNCASYLKGGWWFSTCYQVYLNGIYGVGYITNSINWKNFPTSERIGLKASRMMIRPL